jgi:hypothetical protein
MGAATGGGGLVKVGAGQVVLFVLAAVKSLMFVLLTAPFVLQHVLLRGSNNAMSSVYWSCQSFQLSDLFVSVFVSFHFDTMRTWVCGRNAPARVFIIGCGSLFCGCFDGKNVNISEKIV